MYLSFEELAKKIKNKVIPFKEFDEILDTLFDFDEDENNHPYTFEEIGIQEDGTTKWDCNKNENIEKDDDPSPFRTCEFFTFYTKN